MLRTYFYFSDDRKSKKLLLQLIKINEKLFRREQSPTSYEEQGTWKTLIT